MGAFLRQYRRRAQTGSEPDDRGYDREIEQYLRRLRPEDLDVLLNGEEGERLSLLDVKPSAVVTGQAIWLCQFGPKGPWEELS